jgi:purine-binding chemotaxis protein CheW
MNENTGVVASINRERVSNGAGEYLTFTLGNEDYGIEILKVQEIRGYDAVTQIANTPDFIKGVVNLRGKVVPIVDLRIKFHLGKVEYDEFTVVIILSLNHRVIGIVVDGVSDVMALRKEQILDVPDLVTSIDIKYIVGLATVEEQMLILVDIEQLMSSPEMSLVNNAAIH